MYKIFTLLHLKNFFRIFLIKLRKDIYGFYKYKGNATDICKKIVSDCYNGEYFQVSATGHYNEFWVRDIGWCAESLIKLGYKNELRKSIEYALKIFSEYGMITTSISKNKEPFNFPNVYPVDSLPYLIRTLRLLGAVDLIKKYKVFIEKEIDKYFYILINPRTGLVKKGHFSQMRDHSITFSSCYANVMVAMLSQELKKIKILKNPLEGYDYKKLIIRKFWTGLFFKDALYNGNFITSDSNLFQFYFDIIDDKKIFEKTMKSIKNANLDKPLPLIYTYAKIKQLQITNIFLPNWQKKSVWTVLGFIYLKLLRKIDKKEFLKQKNKWKNIIERYQNVLENYNQKGKPYRSFLYTTDESMLWACLYLTL